MLRQIGFFMFDVFFLIRLSADAPDVTSIGLRCLSHCALVEPKSVAGAVLIGVVSPAFPIAPTVPLLPDPAAAAARAREAAPDCAT